MAFYSFPDWFQFLPGSSVGLRSGEKGKLSDSLTKSQLCMKLRYRTVSIPLVPFLFSKLAITTNFQNPEKELKIS